MKYIFKILLNKKIEKQKDGETCEARRASRCSFFEWLLTPPIGFPSGGRTNQVEILQESKSYKYKLVKSSSK